MIFTLATDEASGLPDEITFFEENQMSTQIDVTPYFISTYANFGDRSIEKRVVQVSPLKSLPEFK